MMPNWHAVALQLMTQHEGWLRVTSASMAPLIQPNDDIQIQALAQPRPGQIVVFETAAGLNTHRVLAVQGSQIVTQGDNAWRADPPWACDQLRGQVVAIRRQRRTVQIDTPYWRTVGVLLVWGSRAGQQIYLARGFIRLLRWGLCRW